jgi:hypothetical protein
MIGVQTPEKTHLCRKVTFMVNPSYNNQRADTNSCFIESNKLANMGGASTGTSARKPLSTERSPR